jgi:antitoxin HicB
MNGNPHWGSSLDDFLKEDGVLEEFRAVAEKEIITLQLQQAMKEQSISKTRMAVLMQTSRSQIDKLLNPRDGNITLETLRRAAAVIGKRVECRLV